MAIEVFNRREQKYRLGRTTFLSLSERLGEYMCLDAHNQTHFTYPICNLYYDTADSHLIRTSLQKPRYKEKLRLRSYGTPTPDSKVYVEIKKKFCGCVNKRRSGILLRDAYAFLADGTAPKGGCGLNEQVLREISYLLSRQRLEPKVYLSYERRAFFGIDDPNIRVSFDTNILTRREDLLLESGNYGEGLLADGEWIMEVKTPSSIPIWLARLLSEYRVYPAGFSKYGREYTKQLAGAAQQQPRRIFAAACTQANTIGGFANV
ncbi:MAG: polyphosphate polymerase domain-containing protein [Clostridium sp.]|nr:polyphosphate polymerase domain-containing protein [Clostridium sp.]